MRGYAPSTIPTDGSYHVAALMDDALRVLDAVGPTGRDVVIGRDWGAIAGAGLAAMPDSPFTKAVIMSVPPAASFRPLGRVPDAGRLAAQLPRQLAHSWYIMYFQLPLLPERSASWVPRRLWRQWSPGYDAAEDLRHVDAAIGTPESWRAALGPYRATVRNTQPPSRYAELHRHWLRRRPCPRCICTAPTTAAPHPPTPNGSRTFCRPAATCTSSSTQAISSNSNNPRSSPVTSSTSSAGFSRSSDRGDGRPAEAAARPAAPPGTDIRRRG